VAQCARLSAILTVQNVEKSFGTRRLLAGVSFAVHERDRVALVGLNGSGKSTLLRLMVSPGSPDPAASPDAGQVTMKRGLRVEYVPQEPRLDGALSVGETLRQGQRAYAAALERLDAIAGELAAAASADDGDRREAALAIGKLGSAADVAALAKAASDPSSFVREAVAIALGQTGSKAAEAPLQILAKDEVLEVREAATRALGSGKH